MKKLHKQEIEFDLKIFFYCTNLIRDPNLSLHLRQIDKFAIEIEKADEIKTSIYYNLVDGTVLEF